MKDEEHGIVAVIPDQLCATQQGGMFAYVILFADCHDLLPPHRGGLRTLERCFRNAIRSCCILFGITPEAIRKLKSGEYRLYARKVNPRTGRRRNLGTFKTRAAAEKHERAVQYFKRAG